MILDPENYASSSSEEDMDLRKDDPVVETEECINTEDERNVSFGSIEGTGGQPGCSSREVELENKVSELNYQLSKLGEENLNLQRAYSTIEDISANLTIDLELSKRKLASLASQ